MGNCIKRCVKSLDGEPYISDCSVRQKFLKATGCLSSDQADHITHKGVMLQLFPAGSKPEKRATIL